jgi:hypothetical protein
MTGVVPHVPFVGSQVPDRQTPSRSEQSTWVPGAQVELAVVQDSRPLQALPSSQSLSLTHGHCVMS